MENLSKTQTYFGIAAAVITIIAGLTTVAFHMAQLYLLWQSYPTQMHNLLTWIHLIH